MERTLSGATTPGQRRPGSDGNEGILRIPQSSSITEASPSDCLVSYQEHSLRESNPFAEKQSIYSTAPMTILFCYSISGPFKSSYEFPDNRMKWIFKRRHIFPKYFQSRLEPIFVAYH